MFATRFVSRLLLPIALVASAAGCSKSPSTPAGAGPGVPSGPGLSAKLVGAWETEPERVKVDGKDVGDPITMTFHFKADGGFRAEGFIPLAGTWKAVKEEGNTLTVLTEVGMPELKFESKTENGKTVQKSEEQVKKEQKTFTITFDGPDAITMTDVGDKPQPMKLKRKK